MTEYFLHLCVFMVVSPFKVSFLNSPHAIFFFNFNIFLTIKWLKYFVMHLCVYRRIPIYRLVVNVPVDRIITLIKIWNGPSTICLPGFCDWQAYCYWFDNVGYIPCQRGVPLMHFGGDADACKPLINDSSCLVLYTAAHFVRIFCWIAKPEVRRLFRVFPDGMRFHCEYCVSTTLFSVLRCHLPSKSAIEVYLGIGFWNIVLRFRYNFPFLKLMWTFSKVINPSLSKFLKFCFVVEKWLNVNGWYSM